MPEPTLNVKVPPVIPEKDIKKIYSAAKEKFEQTKKRIMAEAQPRFARSEASIDTELVVPVNIQKVPRIGGGDADVYTKSGRATYVTVRTDSLSVYADGKHVQFTLLYRIEESHKNQTVLEARAFPRVDVPDDRYSIVRIRHTRFDTNFYHKFYGEDHDWHDLSDESGVTNSYLTDLSIQFDGMGRDDLGNAQLTSTASIPVTLQLDPQ